MKLSKVEKFSWIACPWIFGAAYLVVGLILPAKDQAALLMKIMIGAFGLLFLSLYGIASLLAKLVEKE